MRAADAADPTGPTGAPVHVPSTLYVDDAPSEAHDYLFSFDEPRDDDAGGVANGASVTNGLASGANGPSVANGPVTVWRDDVEVDEERSPLVAAVVCAAKLGGVTPMLAHDSDDSSDEEEERERDLDTACSLAQCAGLLDVPLARVYPPTAQSVVRAIGKGTPVLVVHAGAPCVLHTVEAGGSIGAARFDTCVATATSFTPKDVRYMFGFWSPVAESAPDSAPDSA